MRKIVSIRIEEPHKIICLFNNTEWRELDLTTAISDKYADKILSDIALFKSVQIGEFGELYWANAAEIVGLNGKTEPCNYDISPDFAYFKAKPVSHTVKNAL